MPRAGVLSRLGLPADRRGGCGLDSTPAQARTLAYIGEGQHVGLRAAVRRPSMKKPAPSRDGWYDAIMQRALRARNSPAPARVSSPGRGFVYPARRVGQLAGVKVGGRELVPPVISHAVSGRAAQLARGVGSATG